MTEADPENQPVPQPRREAPPQAVTAEPVADRRVAGGPAQERPAYDQPAYDQPAYEGRQQPAPPRPEQPAYDRPHDQPYDRSAYERQPAGQGYAAEEPRTERVIPGRRADTAPPAPERYGTRPDHAEEAADRDRREAAGRIEDAGNSLQSSVGRLFQQASEEMARMVRAEVRSAAAEAANAREAAITEQRGKLTAAGVAGALGAAALVVALIAVLALFVPLWAASMGVGVVLVAAAAALGRKDARETSRTGRETPKDAKALRAPRTAQAAPTREDIPAPQYARR
ncbi:putative superfamily III holin-X [Actinocorallia herbida]|uniref:Putative superfamily III holin-X n=1 Tax=Actinocorallia herbida TaxID=58109 RepID=A0A3N1CNS7_9ACTN|nr:phage holin family protein [Actinocorallia herbida]ROO82979.1 putative superfamily III holin-X [Actinocorallia herbida]